MLSSPQDSTQLESEEEPLPEGGGGLKFGFNSASGWFFGLFEGVLSILFGLLLLILSPASNSESESESELELELGLSGSLVDC